MQPWRHRRVVAMTSGGGAAAFSPLDISGLKLWLDASQIVGLNDGDAVATWSDASGNGYAVTQGTASARPTYKTGVVNSKPVVRLDGVDDFLENGTFAVNQPCTWFCVAKRTGGNPSYGFVFDSVGADPTRQALIYTVGSTKWTLYAGSLVDESGTTGAVFKSIQAVFNGASSKIIVGGTETTVNPGSQNLANGVCIGQFGAGSNFLFGGDIAELGCYTGVLSAGNLALLQGYLNSKYGL